LEKWVGGLVLAGLALWLAGQWLVPLAARAGLAAALRRAAWYPVRMEIVSLGLNGVEIADLWLEGVGRVKARGVRADFTPGELKRGRLTRLAVSGLEVDLPRAFWDAAGGVGGGIRAPFQELVVQDATVRVEHELGRIELAGGALLRPHEGGLWVARMATTESRWTGSDGRTATLSGVDLRAAARVKDGREIESLTVVAEANEAAMPPARLAGVRARAAREGNDLVWRLMADAKPVSFDLAEGRLAGLFGEPAGLTSGGARVTGLKFADAGFGVSAAVTTAGWRGAGRPDELTVRLSGGGLSYDPAAVRLDGLGGVAVQVGGGARADLAAAALRWGALGFTNLSGRASFATNRLALTVTAGNATGLTVRAVGGWKAGELSRLAISVPSARIGPDELLGDTVERLTGWRCEGVASLAAEFGLADRHASDSAQVAVDLDSLTKEKVTFRGVRGCAEMESLSPLRSRGGQSLVVDEILFGDLRLTDAELVYRIEGTNEVFVESAEWTAWGGRFSCTAFRFRPSDGAFRTTLFCENVEVGDLLRLTASGKVNGRGRLHGRLPVGVRWAPRPAISIGAGFLYSDPGKGSLAVEDAALLEQLVTATAGAPSRNVLMDPVRTKVRETFRDFEYSAARIDFVEGERGRPAGVISVTGKGNQKDGVPVDLKVRFAVDLL
jgi:hypothetical protein